MEKGILICFNFFILHRNGQNTFIVIYFFTIWMCPSTASYIETIPTGNFCALGKTKICRFSPHLKSWIDFLRIFCFLWESALCISRTLFVYHNNTELDTHKTRLEKSFPPCNLRMSDFCVNLNIVTILSIWTFPFHGSRKLQFFLLEHLIENWKQRN